MHKRFVCSEYYLALVSALFAVLLLALADSVGSCWPREGPTWVEAFEMPSVDEAFAARSADAQAFEAAVLGGALS
jgi:hypothetical protein